jgi:histidine triad (HIT) family protein
LVAVAPIQSRLFAEQEENKRGSKDCVFCAIARKEHASSVVFDDDTSLAFLDRRPVFLGHTLLIPKQHYETLADLPRNLVEHFFLNAQLLSRAVQLGTKAEGTFVAVNNTVSQSVPHLHVHIVPRTHGDGLRGFFWPRKKYSSEEQMNEYRDLIRAALSNTMS